MYTLTLSHSVELLLPTSGAPCDLPPSQVLRSLQSPIWQNADVSASAGSNAVLSSYHPNELAIRKKCHVQGSGGGEFNGYRGEGSGVGRSQRVQRGGVGDLWGRGGRLVPARTLSSTNSMDIVPETGGALIELSERARHQKETPRSAASAVMLNEAGGIAGVGGAQRLERENCGGSYSVETSLGLLKFPRLSASSNDVRLLPERRLSLLSASLSISF